MNEYLKIALKLTLICFVAVLLLSLVNLITTQAINNNEKIKEEKANKVIFPDGKNFIRRNFKNPDTNAYYFEVKNNNNNTIGYIVSIIGKGYGGDMKILIAFDTNLMILNMKLLKHNETPGLGDKAATQEYMNKFKNTNTESKPFPDSKEKLSPEERDSVTGATITFNGITKATKNAIELIKNEINK